MALECREAEERRVAEEREEWERQRAALEERRRELLSVRSNLVYEPSYQPHSSAGASRTSCLFWPEMTETAQL